MKKISAILVIVMLLVMTGCGKSDDIDYNDTEKVTFYDLTFEVPKAFKSDTENGNEYIQFFNYMDEEKYNTCMMHYSISDYPNSDMKAAVKEGFLDKTDFTYNEKTINDNKWAIGHREESVKFNQTYYVIVKNGKQYEIGYDDFGSGEKCAEALKVIEKSLNFK